MVKLFLLFIVSENLVMMLSKDLVHFVASGVHIEIAAPTQGAVHRSGRT